MRITRLGALDEGQRFIAIDEAGVAHMYHVRQPAWTGPGEGNEVKARPVPVTDPAALGLGIVRACDLAAGALFLLPETGGWHLYRVRERPAGAGPVPVDQLGAGGGVLRGGLIDGEARVYARA